MKLFFFNVIIILLNDHNYTIGDLIEGVFIFGLDPHLKYIPIV